MSCHLVDLEKVEDATFVELNVDEFTVRKSPVITHQMIIDLFNELAGELEKLESTKDDFIEILNGNTNVIEQDTIDTSLTIINHQGYIKQIEEAMK